MAVSLLPTDPELGLLLARDSAVLSPTATAEEVLREALLASRLRTVVDIGEPLLDAAAGEGVLVTAAADGSVLVAEDGSSRAVASGPPAVDASISAAGDVLLTGGDGHLRLVSARGARLVPRVGGARGASVSADAQLAAVRSTGGEVRLVDLRTGEVRLEVDHGAPVTAVALSVGGRLLATGGVDRIVRIWSVSNGSPLRALRGHVGPITAVSFSARGTLLATASTDGIGRVWNAATGQPVSVLSGHANFLEDIAFSPDGTQVATASADRTAKTWKAETGALLATFAGGTDTVVSVRFTHCGLQLVTASSDGKARIWDAVAQPQLNVVAELGKPVTRVEFTDGGNALGATAGALAYRIRLPRGPAVPVGAAVAIPDAVTASDGSQAVIDGKVVTITRVDGAKIVLSGHRDTVTSVAFSADGERVVTASADHDARIWDASSGALLQVLLGHFAIVSDARFSPDGRWVATAGPATAGLWRTTTGRLVYLLKGHEGKLLSVAFAPDGRRIATGGEDGTVRLYRCTVCGGSDELVALATERLSGTGRVPTDEERRRYGI